MDDLWLRAENAVMAGDAETLDRLLREHGETLRTQQPQSTWSGRLAPNFSAPDARSVITSNHHFESWKQFAAADRSSPFEQAVDAIVAGDVETLRRLLRADPELVRARSPRKHHSTLLHYVGANGVEGFRQRTPKNAVDVARVLIDAGADVNAMADMYGGSDVIGLVATSIHPALAGVQDALIEFLLDRGALLGPDLIRGALANGRGEAAEFLARRAVTLDIEAAAGVGRLDVVKRIIATAGEEQTRDAFAWACEYGRTDVVLFLLDHGVPIEARLRHHGQTGLHWAALGGHLDTVNALLSRRAPLDIRDREFGGTPLDWALHGGHEDVAEALRRAAAS